jgi:hypothetical protein
MCWYVCFGTLYMAWFLTQRATLLHVTGRTHDRQMRHLHLPKWREMMQTQQQERGVTTRHGGVLGSCLHFDQATHGASCQARNESSLSLTRRLCDRTCNKDEGTSRCPHRHQVSVWLLAWDAVCLREKKAKMSTFVLQEMWRITVSSVKIADPVIWTVVAEVGIILDRANVFSSHCKCDLRFSWWWIDNLVFLGCGIVWSGG